MERKATEDEARILICGLMTSQKVAELLGKIRDFDYCTFRHSLNVAYITAQACMSMEISQDQLEQIVLGALLHDVGKIQIDPNIIKKVTSLTPDEFLEIKKHPIYGSEILHKAGFSDMVCDTAYYHHEKKDGTGYPQGCLKDDIPFSAKVVGVIDAYDAMTSERSYKRAYDGVYTLETLQTMEGYSAYILSVVDAVLAR